MSKNDSAFPTWLSVLSTLLLLPALYFVSANLLKYQLGIGSLYAPVDALRATANGDQVFNLIFSPMVIVGGILLAVAINSFLVLRFGICSEEGEIVSTITVKTRAWNLLVLGVCIGLTTVIGAYLVFENILSQLP